jgi:hypothetical protein
MELPTVRCHGDDGSPTMLSTVWLVPVVSLLNRGAIGFF